MDLAVTLSAFHAFFSLCLVFSHCPDFFSTFCRRQKQTPAAGGKNTHHHPIVIVPWLIFRNDRNDNGLWRWLQLCIISYLDSLKFKVDQKQNCQCHAKREPSLEPVHQTLFRTTFHFFFKWNTQMCMLRSLQLSGDDLEASYLLPLSLWSLCFHCWVSLKSWIYLSKADPLSAPHWNLFFFFLGHLLCNV